MAETSLPCVCGNTGYKIWATVNQVTLVECLSCKIVRVEKLDKEKYSGLYQSGQYHAKGSEDLLHESAGREPHKSRLDTDIEVAHLRVQKLWKYRTSGNLIDVGCANGAFMLVAEDHGFDVEGVDLSHEGLASMQLKPLVRIGELNRVGFQRRYADVITFNDSFEHFIDPLVALKAAHGILKRTGILVIEIPDMGSADAKERREKFKHVKPHEHLWYFSATQLRDLLEANGFTVLGMDVPISGKVTVYASPAAVVEEIEILGPPGIGDIIWTLHKIMAIREAEMPCRIKYVVCVEGQTKMSTRAKDFILMCKWIDSVEFREIPLPRDVGCEDPSIPRYELIANDYLDPKTSPWKGNYIEDYHPEIPTSWNIGIKVPDAALEQAENRLSKIGPYVAVYMSSHVWNRVTLQPYWLAKQWAEFCIGLADSGLRPVILGAGWDAEFANDVAENIVALGREPSKVWVNLTGRTPIALAMAYMHNAEVTVGICAGLPIIAGYMGWPSVIAWPVRGVSEVDVTKMLPDGRCAFCPEFRENWLPPHVRKSGSYTAVTVGEFTPDSLVKTTLAQREHSAKFSTGI